MRQTSPSRQLAAQVAFAEAAYAKAAKAKTSAIAPDLIEANEQERAEAVLTDSNRLARKHDERCVHAARAPPTRLLSKRQVLDIANVSYPTLWSWMRRGSFPRSRAVGGKSMWVLTCTSKPNAVVQPRGVAAIRTSVIRGVHPLNRCGRKTYGAAALRPTSLRPHPCGEPRPD